MGLSEEDVIRHIVSLSTRLGPKIQLQQLSSVPQTPQEAQILPQIEQEIQKKRGSLAPPKLANLEAKAEVLRITGAFRQLLGRPPTVYQVLAVPAIRDGLDSDQLDTISRIMHNTYCNTPIQMTWDGATSGVRTAITRNIPPRVEDVLFNAKDRSLDSYEISAGITEQPDSKNLQLLNCALQLLEVAGFVRKQPPHAEPVKDTASLSVWSHRAYKNPFPRHPNSRLYVLDELFNHGNPRRLYTTDLYKQYITRGRGVGNPNALYHQRSVLPAISHLRDAGLVDTTTITYGALKNTATLVGLTPAAVKYLKSMHKHHSLPEPLRKLLLSEKKP